jgi:hypothetical protein
MEDGDNLRPLLRPKLLPRDLGDDLVAVGILGVAGKGE